MQIRPSSERPISRAAKPSDLAARGAVAPSEERASNTSRSLDGKLQRIRDVQYAFTLALRAGQAIENRYLFDPIR